MTADTSERGVYLAPSLFEAGFVSVAHTMEDIKETGMVASEVLGKING